MPFPKEWSEVKINSHVQILNACYWFHLHKITVTLTMPVLQQYSSMPPTRVNCHKVLFIVRVKEEGRTQAETRHCWSILAIGLLGAMWTILDIVKTQGMKPGDFADHRFTRSGDLVQCESILVMVYLPVQMPCDRSYSVG